VDSALVGTRDELLQAVYQRVSGRSATRFEHIDHLSEVIDIFMTTPDDSIGRIMGWAALEGDHPASVFGHSPALDQVTAVMVRQAERAGRTMPDDEARLLAAFLQVVALGWRLFRSIGLAGAGVDATTDADRQITAWLQELADSVVHGHPTEPVTPPAP
jgi:AcrR family transcriptional regulator